MDKRQKSGNARPAKRRLVSFAWAFVGLAALPLVGGCNSAQQLHSGDPLVGEFYPKGPQGQPLPPSPPSNAQNNKTTPSVAPIPSANSATSNAALANNSNLPGGRPLAINERSGPNWMLTTSTNNGNPKAGSPSSGPTVQPVPRDTTGPVSSNNQPGLQAANWTYGANTTDSRLPPMGTTTVEVLEGTLKAKGAVGLKQEAVPEGVRISCYAPSRTNTNNLRFYETTAPNLLSAMQAILQQIDQQP